MRFLTAMVGRFCSPPFSSSFFILYATLVLLTCAAAYRLGSSTDAFYLPPRAYCLLPRTYYIPHLTWIHWFALVPDHYFLYHLRLCRHRRYHCHGYHPYTGCWKGKIYHACLRIDSVDGFPHHTCRGMATPLLQDSTCTAPPPVERAGTPHTTPAGLATIPTYRLYLVKYTWFGSLPVPLLRR